MAIAKEPSSQVSSLTIRLLRNPHLWGTAIIFILLVIVHYMDAFTNIPVLDKVSAILGLGLTRHTVERILFLVPITYVTAIFGIGGGISVLLLAIAMMLPRVFLISQATREALFETGGVILTGLLIVLLFDALQRGKQHLIDLETAQGMLNLQVQRLGMLHVISEKVSQSLELEQVMATIDSVGQLMHADASWLYLYDRDERKLRLASFHGFSGPAAPESLLLGEDIDGKVAESRKYILIENVSAKPGLKPRLLRKTGIQSLLVVPLVAKGEMVGTLGVGNTLEHCFPSDEIDLLHAIADQISMAIEKARLYERERSAGEALRVSEKKYRELFENASDAIWVHDLNGRIMAVNSAFEKLIGYKRDVLCGANVSMFISSHGMSKIDREAHNVVLRGETAVPYEQELIKKDGSTVAIQIGTSLIYKEGEPWAFQHTARDISEEKRLRDNLRTYVQKVSQAQEAERKRIARELHDETAQALVAVVRNLEDVDSGHSRFNVKDIREQVRDILKGVRHFSQQLRPSILDDLGLLPAVKWLASDLTKIYSIATDVKVIGQPRQLSPDAEMVLFRITQEALNNVQKHSQANSVSITVEFADHTTRLTICDNGKGFEMPERVGDLARTGKLGLVGMQERAQLLGGNLTVSSSPAKGTTLTVEEPL